MLKTFRVQEAKPDDAMKGLARIHNDDMRALNLSEGDLIELTGSKTTPARVRSSDDIESGIIQIDGLIRENAGVSLDENINLESSIIYHFAGSITLQPLIKPDADESYILSLLEAQAVRTGDRVRLNLFGTRTCDFLVTSTTPDGTVIINKSTYLNLLKPLEINAHKISYEDIGGLSSQIRKVREMIELPLRFPQVFERLGIQPPRGVLLYGPPGTGKTVIARAVANETDAWFTHISGPEIIGKFYGESEERLRKIFEEAQDRAPSIIFIDEIDAIAPKRADMGGEKQVERRVVAQLLALMDGLKSRGQLIVIGATNIPNSLDPALRRPGRFDREISIPIPDRNGRLEILKIHTRGMPLAQDVDLMKIADLSHGYVGADLEALAKEAAMSCVRDILPMINFSSQLIPYEKIAKLEVTHKHFMNALLETNPSATREVFVEVPDVKFSDLGGLDEIKQQLINAVRQPIDHTEIFSQYNISQVHGILLYGPVGVGKTSLVKALAHESGLNFINVQSANLLSRYQGDSERALKNIFRVAKQAAPSIIFLDGIDTLFPEKTSDSQTLKGQFMTEMDSIAETGGVTVIAATDNPRGLDKSLFMPSVFDLRIKVSVPDINEREEIFRLSLENKPLDSDINFAELAESTEGLTGGDIKYICRSAIMEALNNDSENFIIKRENFDEHIESFSDVIAKRRETLEQEKAKENAVEISAEIGYPRLDIFLAEKLGLSRTSIQRILKRGGVSFNGDLHLKGSMKVSPGDKFLVQVPESENLTVLEGEDVPFDIIYEDEHLIIVNKPAGIVVHPGTGNWHGTLIQGLVKRYPEMKSMDGFMRPGIVSRLDMGTSGLMVVARNQDSFLLLQKMFASREVDKRYIALIHGHLAQPEGILSGPIDVDPNDPLKRVVIEGGKPAITGYKVIKEAEKFSLVECKLYTGRTHQIRVHMSAAGCPLYGDFTYGAQEKFMNRVFLHSWKLSFIHPITGQELKFRQNIPEEFINLLHTLNHGE
ncbi:MAG: RluA family pseudouridine synthase [Synergistaceae bacterium]|nr:RluA family pseudouridine synthase [Synergistaceae bacterium]